jgi:hypothetical protein
VPNFLGRFSVIFFFALIRMIWMRRAFRFQSYLMASKIACDPGIFGSPLTLPLAGAFGISSMQNTR